MILPKPVQEILNSKGIDPSILEIEERPRFTWMTPSRYQRQKLKFPWRAYNDCFGLFNPSPSSGASTLLYFGFTLPWRIDFRGMYNGNHFIPIKNILSQLNLEYKPEDWTFKVRVLSLLGISDHKDKPLYCNYIAFIDPETRKIFQHPHTMGYGELCFGTARLQVLKEYPDLKSFVKTLRSALKVFNTATNEGGRRPAQTRLWEKVYEAVAAREIPLTGAQKIESAWYSED